MRITENMRIAQTAHSLSRSAREVYDLTAMATTGRKINRPSDGPAAYASIVSRNERMELLGSRKSTLERAEHDVALAETTLATAGDIMARVREIAVSMADAEPGPNERLAMATEVANLRDHLVGLANTRGTRGYLFGGTATKTPPIDVNGVFQGNNAAINVEYADGQTSAVNLSGQDAFTALSGGRDIFQDLTDLETELLADNQQGVHLLISTIDQGHKQITSVRAEAGVKMTRFSSARDVTENALVVVRSAQASDREGDATEVFSDLATAQVAYERSLAVTRQVLGMTSAMERF
jgi:flagellar hook-associated protein 3 FlgL